MARRKHRRNPRAKYKVKHVVLKKNPRRRRRNPEGGFDETGGMLPLTAQEKAFDRKAAAVAAEAPIGPMFGPTKPPRGHYARLRTAAKKDRDEEVKRLRKLAKSTRKGAKGRGVTAMAKRAQAARIEAIAAVLAKKGKAVQKSPLIKAMTVKSNPGLGGLAILVPQAVASTVGFVGSAHIGKALADALTMDTAADGSKTLKASYQKDGKQTAVAKYAPAAGTLLTSLGMLIAANKLAPRYQIGVALGGMSAAIMQAVLASDDIPATVTKDMPFTASLKRSLGLGEYTTVGGGIFRGVGEYTTVGQAHPFRPRNYGDNQMEFAATGGLGLLEDRGGHDNASEFAPGEGGIFTKMPSMR